MANKPKERVEFEKKVGLADKQKELDALLEKQHKLTEERLEILAEAKEVAEERKKLQEEIRGIVSEAQKLDPLTQGVN